MTGQDTWPAPLPSRPYPGQQIRLMFEGELSEPFTVTAHQGRTEEHLVLRGPCGLFEHYFDPLQHLPRLSPFADGDQTPVKGD